MLALLQAAPLVHEGRPIELLDLKTERDTVMGALRRANRQLEVRLASPAALTRRACLRFPYWPGRHRFLHDPSHARLARAWRALEPLSPPRRPTQPYTPSAHAPNPPTDTYARAYRPAPLYVSGHRLWGAACCTTRGTARRPSSAVRAKSAWPSRMVRAARTRSR
jgi:hypothetical protein